MISFEPLPEFKPKFSVVGCFIESDGEVLYLHRSPDRRQGGTWCVPGGKIDEGETVVQAIAREVFEETGISLPIESLQFRFQAFVRYAEYDFPYHVFSVVLNTRPDVRINPEHQAFQWISPTKALDLPVIQDEDVCLKKCYGL